MIKQSKVFQYYDSTYKHDVYYQCIWTIAYTYAEIVSYEKSHIMNNAIQFYENVINNTCGLCENRRAQ